LGLWKRPCYKKLAYGALSGKHTVFFSKRRKADCKPFIFCIYNLLPLRILLGVGSVMKHPFIPIKPTFHLLYVVLVLPFSYVRTPLVFQSFLFFFCSHPLSFSLTQSCLKYYFHFIQLAFYLFIHSKIWTFAQFNFKAACSLFP